MNILLNLQGKRSSADHVSQAVNYIKDLQNKIKKLNKKKNRLNKSIPGTVTAHPTTEECTSSVSSSLSTSSRRCSCADDKHITVIVMPCFHGMEIIISCCLERNQFRLSSVLQILAQEERLSVVSCLSTRLQQRFIHTIVSQVKLLLKHIIQVANIIFTTTRLLFASEIISFRFYYLKRTFFVVIKICISFLFEFLTNDFYVVIILV